MNLSPSQRSSYVEATPFGFSSKLLELLHNNNGTCRTRQDNNPTSRLWVYKAEAAATRCAIRGFTTATTARTTSS